MSEIISNSLLLSPGGGVSASESSARGTDDSSGLSEEMAMGLGCIVGCLVSSEGLRRLGDRRP